MAASKDKLIRYYRRRRDRAAETVQRAVRRTARALKNSHPIEAARARRVARKYRKQKSWFLRKIRHRRKVLAIRKRTREAAKEGILWYDGHKVAAWIVPFLDHARAHGWPGHLLQGLRTIEEAWYLWNNASRLGLIHYVSVAYPGTSNHIGYIWPKGAIDVSDPFKFADLEHGRTINGKTLRSYGKVVGPRDWPHFSATGH